MSLLGRIQVVEDEGVAVANTRILNFVGAGVSVSNTSGKTTVTIAGGSISDGDYGDITVSGGGTVWTVDGGVGGSSSILRTFAMMGA